MNHPQRSFHALPECGDSLKYLCSCPPQIEVANPLEIDSWDELLLEIGDNEFFHTRAWAETLHNSYGYEPIYFVHRQNGRPAFLMPFMQVDSTLTGRRGVSLPFTDQCDPFIDNPESLPPYVDQVLAYARSRRWRYAEWRGTSLFLADAPASTVHYAHDIDLTQSPDRLLAAMADSTRRNIRKAQRLGVSVQVGASQEALNIFSRLNRLTRRRHRLPPQPNIFFAQLMSNVISKGMGSILIAKWENRSIAAAVFLHFANRVIYKYGASDEKMHYLRANNLLIYTALDHFRKRGYQVLSLGRTESQHKGLLQYKRGWGAHERQLPSYRYDLRRKTFVQHSPRSSGSAVFGLLPLWACSLIGKVLYRHFA